MTPWWNFLLYNFADFGFQGFLYMLTPGGGVEHMEELLVVLLLFLLALSLSHREVKTKIVFVVKWNWALNTIKTAAAVCAEYLKRSSAPSWMNAGLQMLMRSSRFCFSSTRRRSTSWMIPAVPGQSATGHVAAALQTSFPQTSLAPRATSNWSGKTWTGKAFYH